MELCLVFINELGNLSGELCWIGLDLFKSWDLICVLLNFFIWDVEGKVIFKVK